MNSESQPEAKKSILNRVWPSRLSLMGALTLAIGAACLIVGLAYSLYWNDPNRKYDLARPGAQDNLSLRIEDDEADTTSPVTAASTKQKIEYLNKELNALNGISRFGPEDLSDQNIQLAPAEQPSR